MLDLTRLLTAPQIIAQRDPYNSDPTLLELEEARASAVASDSEGLLRHLRNAGKKAVDVASVVGTKVAQDAP